MPTRHVVFCKARSKDRIKNLADIGAKTFRGIIGDIEQVLSLVDFVPGRRGKGRIKKRNPRAAEELGLQRRYHPFKYGAFGRLLREGESRVGKPKNSVSQVSSNAVGEKHSPVGKR